MKHYIRLTPAQVSALQCLDGGGITTEHEPVLLQAWHDAREYSGQPLLRFMSSDAATLCRELTELANSEDHVAQFGADAAARRAAAGARTALSNLADKIWREMRAHYRKKVWLEVQAHYPKIVEAE